MSRKKSIQAIIARYEAETKKLNEQKKNTRENKELQYQEKENILNSIKAQRVTLANLLQ